jgi:hypothetical protein
MFSGEVNAPINYPLNVPLNATSLDFRANLFVASRATRLVVHLPTGFCTTWPNERLFAVQLPRRGLASICQWTSISPRTALYSKSLLRVRCRALNGGEIGVALLGRALFECCTARFASELRLPSALAAPPPRLPKIIDSTPTPASLISRVALINKISLSFSLEEIGRA